MEFDGSHLTFSGTHPYENPLRCPPGITVFVDPYLSLEIRHTRKRIDCFELNSLGIIGELYTEMYPWPLQIFKEWNSGYTHYPLTEAGNLVTVVWTNHASGSFALSYVG